MPEEVLFAEVYRKTVSFEKRSSMKVKSVALFAVCGALPFWGCTTNDGLERFTTGRAFDRDVFVQDANYDRSKISVYKLEDPLRFKDGRKVESTADWKDRREEILDVFASEMYGQLPPDPDMLVTELVDKKTSAAGYAVRHRYRMWFRSDRSGPCVNWVVWIPRFSKKPAPVILFLNYRGNHELVCDPDIEVTEAWCRNEDFVEDHRTSESARGRMQDQNEDTIFPLQILMARGYAVMSACYAEISPDPTWMEEDPSYRQDVFAYTGVFDLWGARDSSRKDNITSLGAWAWALSRGLDLAEKIKEIDAEKSVVTGCSRLAKAALLAAARDERFAVCVPVQTGGGGVPLAKRDFGENVSIVNRAFTHWYCPAYAKYAKEPWKSLTFDQHLLLATIAPRGLLVEGFDMPWYDTEGEFLAVQAANPVWKFLGKSGMPDVAWPDDFDTSAIGRDLGYVRRSEGHGVSAYDWLWLLDFADGILRCGK